MNKNSSALLAGNLFPKPSIFLSAFKKGCATTHTFPLRKEPSLNRCYYCFKHVYLKYTMRASKSNLLLKCYNFGVKENKNSILQTLSITKWVLGLYFKNYPFYTSVYFVSEIILQLGNLINAYIIAVVTDMAISTLTKGVSPTSIDEFIPIVALIVGANLFFEVIRILDNFARRMINHQDWWNLRRLQYEQMLTLGIARLENPEITNKSQRYSEETQNIFGFLEMLIMVAGNFTGFIGASIVLLSRIPIVALVFGISVVLQWMINQRFIRKIWILNRDTTEIRRRASQTLNALTDPVWLKELIITKGNKYLSNKYEDYFGWYFQKVKNIRISQSKWNIFNEIIDGAGLGFGIILILKRLVQGLISIGQLTFEIRSLSIFSNSFSAAANNLVGIRESAIRLADVRELFTNYEPDKDGVKELPTSKTPIKIKFENTYFKYPNSKRTVLKDLNLEIKPGEKIAIVGENGAGKTTLVKLICRLYRTSKGKIMIDNKDINDLKLSTWYKKLGVLFQDFNAYSHLTVRENVEIGNPQKNSTDEEIKKALQKADALDFVSKYPKFLDQTLSERYKGGIRPSSGQWQKIAIARFFFRNTPILILDEPTASIDAVAEAQIFDNIYKFIEDKTVIIISHRFATVRNADRIIVLDKGQIIEEGSHEELLEKDGKYAHAFKLQARGYQ